MNKALLIGINDYKTAPLEGCVNDVELAQQTLERLKFECSVLLNKDATKQNIIDELNALMYGATEEDSLVLHFSGHGSQVPDVSGDESDDIDECLLPYNFDWDNVILDDDINSILLSNVKARIEVILDSCHSGACTRSVLDPVFTKRLRDRYIEPPSSIFKHINPTAYLYHKLKLRNVIAWSGCREDQTSADTKIAGRAYGMFSFAFYNCLTINRACTLIAVRDYIEKHGYSQVPQLECHFSAYGSKPIIGNFTTLASIFARYRCINSFKDM